MFHIKRWLVKNPGFTKARMHYNLPLLRITMRHKFNLLKDFPYKFNNKKTLVSTIDEFDRTDMSIMASLNNMLEDERYQLREGFTFAYVALLNMIKDHDSRSLGGVVEPMLRKDIDEELHEIVFEDIGLKTENEEDLEHNPMKIDIIDYAYHLGADINRESNRIARVQKYDPGYFQKSRKVMYVTEDLELGKQIIVNIEVLVRFITNFKLNAYLKDHPEVTLISARQVKDKEVHFVRFEMNLAREKVSTSMCELINIVDNMELYSTIKASEAR